MSNAQNLAYSAIQVLHNFGAVATVGGSFAALLSPPGVRKKLAWLAFAGWTTQAVSGSAFGLTSYYFYHRFPDISGIALTALTVKIICVAFGFLLVSVYLLRYPAGMDRLRERVWPASTILAATALTAAAILRWFA